jgi:ABC-type lipoprotein export system ATPase subunit/GNAT superfamily N-acetyltransferase
MTKRKHEYFKITKIAKRYDRQTGKFTYNIAYETAVPPTPRTKAVAEAFGLGIDEAQKFVLYGNVELKISPTDIAYITGDSGSGKSILLKAIKKDLGQEAIDITKIPINPEKPIIETVGKTLNQALELLSKVGLNDAFLFLRKYSELSDGQKYRYRLAKLIETQKQWWIMDEFCSTLDRDTAKIVAYNLQKLARQQRKAVLAATTHTDLFQDLNPSIHIHKRFGKEINIHYYPNKPTQHCSIIKEMQVEEASIADYKRLSIFHYRSSHCPAPRKIFRLKRGEELCGVIVYSYPPPIAFGRSKVWKGTFSQLQKEMSTITRVIIHPKYRTTGLGTKLVKETLPLAGTPYVETLAVMAKYNPFFEKAGMQKIAESKPNKNLLNTIEQLCILGFNPTMLTSTNQNLQKIRQNKKDEVVKVLEELSRKECAIRKRLTSSSKAYPKHDEFADKMRKIDEEDLAAILKKLAFLAHTKVYLFWRHSQKQQEN